MGAIVPAVLPSSREDLERQLKEVSGFADSVQINIVDGVFASPATWPYATASQDLAHMIMNRETLPLWGRFRFEIELQVRNPQEVMGQWISVGANRLTIHADSATNLHSIFRELAVTYGHDKGFAPDLLSVGLAISMETDLSVIDEHIDSLDYVQFICVSRLGRHGEPFEKAVIERIKTIHKKYPSLPIQADGGVSLATAPDLLAAGVGRLIVGGDLWRAENRAERYGALSKLVEQYGTYE